jgi:RsiW-degrading membrane proteinase PrsW (M82 family)
VILTFVWGACGATAASLVGNTALVAPLALIVGAESAEQLSAVLIAPVVEEPMKALVFLALLRSRHFDSAADGFVYGAATGLGFGMTENALYFVGVASTGDAASWLSTVFIRTFFSGLMHAVCASWVGASLGAARFRPAWVRFGAGLGGFAIAMGIHAMWNGLLTAGELTGDDSFGTRAFVVQGGMFVLALLGFQLALWQERRLIVAHLAGEVAAGRVPAVHAEAVGSFWRRSRPTWVPLPVPARPYVRALTTLALRLRGAAHAPDHDRPFHADEVERLRREVAALQKLERSVGPAAR